MEGIVYEVVTAANASPPLVTQLNDLGTRCFPQVSPHEREAYFLDPVRAWGYASDVDKVVGFLKLHFKTTRFKQQTIKIGGAVGVCVMPPYRQRGIGKTLMKLGLAYLLQRGCDIACLATDPVDGGASVGLYQKLGFQKLNRLASFEDIHGRLHYDPDVMVAPLNSSDVFHTILNSKEIFHYGRGYW